MGKDHRKSLRDLRKRDAVFSILSKLAGHSKAQVYSISIGRSSNGMDLTLAPNSQKFFHPKVTIYFPLEEELLTCYF